MAFRGRTIRLRGGALPGASPDRIIARQSPKPGAPAHVPSVWLEPRCDESADPGPPRGEPLITRGPTSLISGLYLDGGPLVRPVRWAMRRVRPLSGLLDGKAEARSAARRSACERVRMRDAHQDDADRDDERSRGPQSAAPTVCSTHLHLPVQSEVRSLGWPMPQIIVNSSRRPRLTSGPTDRARDGAPLTGAGREVQLARTSVSAPATDAVCSRPYSVRVGRACTSCRAANRAHEVRRNMHNSSRRRSDGGRVQQCETRRICNTTRARHRGPHNHLRRPHLYDHSSASPASRGSGRYSSPIHHPADAGTSVALLTCGVCSAQDRVRGREGTAEWPS